MNKERRWLKAVIAESKKPLPALPWERSARIATHRIAAPRTADLARTPAACGPAGAPARA